MLDPALKAWIDKVIIDTEARQIPWKLVNPTTYTWEMSQPRPARVVLQRVERIEVLQVSPGRVQQRKTTTHLLLQAFDLSNPNLPRVTLNGQEDTDANESLTKMYQAVASAANQETLEFLNSLLPKAPRA